MSREQPDTFASVKKRWREQALAMVPPEYANRGMHAKYLRMDNHAAGLDEAAAELESGLEQRVRELRDALLSYGALEGQLSEYTKGLRAAYLSTATALTALLGEK